MPRESDLSQEHARFRAVLCGVSTELSDAIFRTRKGELNSVAQAKMRSLFIEDTVLSMGHLAFDIYWTIEDVLKEESEHSEEYVGRELAKLSGRVFHPEYRYPMPATLAFVARLGIGLGSELEWLRPPISTDAKGQAASWFAEFGEALKRFSDFVVRDRKLDRTPTG